MNFSFGNCHLEVWIHQICNTWTGIFC